ncbi:flagellar basal body protein [Caulobacter sp.]|uniref:flagellar basal body protein n=1 Tax=Caulobacter sp. TaxID=78 RepID=UPI002B46E326|nr:flagellar basal body protein [Caulobacter sp.]HJV40472.1 flagellar basal body protein [Caulobacter sp.]
MAIAAVDADDRVHQLTLLTERLTDLIAKEAQAFESRRPHEAAQYVEETAKLANVYRHESMRVRANVALVEAARPELRQRLLRATEAFDAVLARQARAVEAAKVVTEGLVRAVAEEIASQRAAPATTYGAGGMVNDRPAMGAAITLNRKA